MCIFMCEKLYYLYDYVAFNEGSGGGAEIQVCLISRHEKYVEIAGVSVIFDAFERRYIY